MTNSAELFRQLAKSRVLQPEPEVSVSTEEEIKPPSPETNQTEATKKRGRPATGKRSDPNWIGRTYYIRRETDLDVESELLQLKRQGQELDKSELVDSLLVAWIKWRQGENIEFYLAEFSPRQK